jgi:FeS assembly SUF system protein
MDGRDFLPGFSAGEAPQEYQAHAGAKLPPGQEPAGQAAVIAALQEIYDPEIPVNIYELGLIYDLEITENGDVKVEMSLTAPGCPVAGEMPGQVAEKVASVPGCGEVEVSLVWDPPWTPDRMSEDARLALGFV